MVPGNVDVAKVVKKKVRICIELIMSDSKTQGVQRGLEMKAPPWRQELMTLVVLIPEEHGQERERILLTRGSFHH